jgi:hypothetical protein
MMELTPLVLLVSAVKHVLGRVRNLNGRHKDGSEMPISLLINERIEGGKRTFCAHINQITEQIEAHVTIDHKGSVHHTHTHTHTHTPRKLHHRGRTH